MTEQEKPKNHRIKIIPLRNRPGLCGPAAAWFSGKWGIPEAEYRRSMKGMLQKSAAVPQWYVTLGGKGKSSPAPESLKTIFTTGRIFPPIYALCL